MFLAIQYLVLEEQGDTWSTTNLCNDSPPRLWEGSGYKYIARWMNFNADASQHKDENTDIVEKLSKG